LERKYKMIKYDATYKTARLKIFEKSIGISQYLVFPGSFILWKPLKISFALSEYQNTISTGVIVWGAYSVAYSTVILVHKRKVGWGTWGGGVNIYSIYFVYYIFHKVGVGRGSYRTQLRTISMIFTFDNKFDQTDEAEYMFIFQI
jgi:hypothetical protein